MNLRSSSIPIFSIFSIVLSLIVVIVMIFNAAFQASRHADDRCRSNIELASQHVERLTDQSKRVVQGIAAWMDTNPNTNFISSPDLLALSPVMNVDSKDTYAIAIIEADGKTWLLDPKYAGKSFDVSKRPYFASTQSLNVGEIGFGPRSNNVNTGRDTIAVFYKVMFNSKPIVISTAFSIGNIEAFFSKAIGNSNSSIEFINNGIVDVSITNNKHIVKDRNQLFKDLTVPADVLVNGNTKTASTLMTAGCVIGISGTPFSVFATVSSYDTFKKSTPLIIGIIIFTIFAAITALISHRKINSLVSGLRKSERRFRHLFENSEVSIWNEDFSEVCKALEKLREDGVTDLHQYLNEHNQNAWNIVEMVNVIHVNKATLKLFNAKTEENFLFNIKDTFGSNAFEVFKKLLCAIWERNEIFRAEAEYRTLDGEKIYCIISLPIPETLDGFKNIPVSIFDITELKRMEESLNSALVDAERANQSKSEFLASMSHELRTPLNAILGFSDILQNQYFGPPGAGKYREYAADIHHSGVHLLELVNDILDISSIEAGETFLSKEPLMIKTIIDDCNRTVSERALSKGIQLEATEMNNLPLLYADKRAVKQILLNLLSNSIKFTQKGGIITVTAYTINKGMCIQVVDNGLGIPIEKLHKITDPFNRIGRDPHIAEQGWGLGLAIVKSLVDLHDGVMKINSEFGKGTSVTIEIPSHSSNAD